MARIYVASSWRNLLQENVVNELRSVGHEVYDFKNPTTSVGFRWSDVGLKDDHTAKEFIDTIQTHPLAARGFMSDFRAMRWADTCVLVNPCGRSAHIEAGWMSGAGKRVIILTHDKEEPELMYLIADHIVTSVHDVLALLKI